MDAAFPLRKAAPLKSMSAHSICENGIAFACCHELQSYELQSYEMQSREIQ
jgi:hypothetical protein